jgi:hypothetical protein
MVSKCFKHVLIQGGVQGVFFNVPNGKSTNVGKTMPSSTPFLMVYTTHKNGDLGDGL